MFMGVSKYFNNCFFVFCRTSPHSDHMENIDGYLMKYTNLVTGWQYRCSFVNSYDISKMKHCKALIKKYASAKFIIFYPVQMN